MKEIGLIGYVDECPRTITIPGMHYTWDTKDNIQARGIELPDNKMKNQYSENSERQKNSSD